MSCCHHTSLSFLFTNTTVPTTVATFIYSLPPYLTDKEAPRLHEVVQSRWNRSSQAGKPGGSWFVRNVKDEYFRWRRWL